MKYVPALDGFRFLAAMIVFLGHFSNETGIWGQIFGKGAEEIGVVMFFCLSGFLMGALYLPKAVSAADLRGFIIRRLGRVLPLFYFINIASFCLILFGFAVITFAIDPVALVGALTLTDGTHVMWTIVAECYFYFIFAFIWLAFSKSSRVAIILLVTGMAISYYLQFSDAELRRENVFLYLHIFGAGVVVSLLMHDDSISRRLDWVVRRPMLANGAFWLVGFFVVIYFPKISSKLGLPRLGTYDSLVLVVLCCTFLWLAMKTSTGKALLGNSVARFGGRISYSIYLWHFPVIWNFLPLLSGIPREVQLFLATACLIAVSWVSFKVIEEPGQKWFRSIDQNLGRRAIEGSSNT